MTLLYWEFAGLLQTVLYYFLICYNSTACALTTTASKAHDITKRQEPTFGPCGRLIPTCDDIDGGFRTTDGTCNNLMHSTWGACLIAYNRILPNTYESGENASALVCCDSPTSPAPTPSLFCFPISVPTKNEKRFPPGGCLEFARSLSVLCGGGGGRFEQLNVQTAYIDGSAVYSFWGPGQSDLRLGEGVFKECFFFNAKKGYTTDVDELAFIMRSLNYSPTLEEVNSYFQKYVKGLLKTVDEVMLPRMEGDRGCLLEPGNPNNYYCFKAGDLRSNLEPGHASLHTLLLREHNRIARALAIVNPGWADERLFQEARKIVSAEMQQITYNEWLPLVLGRARMNAEGLSIAKSGFSDMYNTSVDATLVNSFSAAILRFGHSQVHRRTGKIGHHNSHRREYPLTPNFLRPNLVLNGGHSGPGDLLCWTSATKCPRTDRSLEDTMRNDLLLDDNGDSMDIAAVNIQRGRDQGLPPYNDFRELCGFGRAMNFKTGADGLKYHSRYNAHLLSLVYRCPDDIDLYTGALTETRIKGTLLGPTATCIMVEQFKRLKFGDRFWYERNANEAFTSEQLTEIRKVRLSTLMCENTESRSTHRNVFLTPISKSYVANSVPLKVLSHKLYHPRCFHKSCSDVSKTIRRLRTRLLHV